MTVQDLYTCCCRLSWLNFMFLLSAKGNIQRRRIEFNQQWWKVCCNKIKYIGTSLLMKQIHRWSIKVKYKRVMIGLKINICFDQLPIHFHHRCPQLKVVGTFKHQDTSIHHRTNIYILYIEIYLFCNMYVVVFMYQGN